MREKRRVGNSFIIAAATVVACALALDAQTLPAGFVEILPDEIKWQPHPAVSGGEFAVLLGKPIESQPLILRVKLPANTEFMPHTHPEARTYNVLSGEWKLGFGEEYDAAALRSYPAGSVYRLPAKVAHFQATGRSETIVQIESVGPTSTDFVNPAHAPRRK